METQKIAVTLNEIAAKAGYTPASDGKLDLPATQAVADALASAAMEIIGHWNPGDPAREVVVTGGGPTWAHLKVSHALHGLVVKYTYAAPNFPACVIYSHGADAAQ